MELFSDDVVLIFYFCLYRDGHFLAWAWVGADDDMARKTAVSYAAFTSDTPVHPAESQTQTMFVVPYRTLQCANARKYDSDDDELNINPPTPCQIGKRPPAPKPKRESAGHQGVAGGGCTFFKLRFSKVWESAVLASYVPKPVPSAAGSCAAGSRVNSSAETRARSSNCGSSSRAAALPASAAFRTW